MEVFRPIHLDQPEPYIKPIGLDHLEPAQPHRLHQSAFSKPAVPDEPEPVLTKDDIRLLEQTQAKKRGCPWSGHPLSGEFYFAVVEMYVEHDAIIGRRLVTVYKKGVRLQCPGCLFDER